MLKVLVILCAFSAVLGGPAVSHSKEEIEAFRSYLENTREDTDSTLDERIAANPKAKIWENSGKFEGDILLDDDQIEGMTNAATSRKAYIWPNTKWPNNTVVYEFGNGEFGSNQQAAILAGIAEIERNTCVRFRRRRAGEFNYVRLTGRQDGCYANVGYWATRGVHTLNLARCCCFLHTTIIHEWIHIIGFVHMQSTHNRDDYVRVMWNNIIPGMEHNFDKYTTQVVGNLGLPYDYASNMHYDAYGFTSNGRPTLVPYFDFLGVMGQEEYVTDIDWLRINRHYNCPGAWSTEVKSEEKSAK